LEKGDVDRPGEALKALAIQLQKIPVRGIGFELLLYDDEDKETAERLQQLPRPEILFNYLGRQSRNKKLVEAYEYPGPACDPRNLREFILDFTALILEGCLVTNWRYSKNLHRPATVKSVADYHTQWLRSLIAHHGSGQ
jgi:non-ribosomal peptide synthase protein (TIGR01720 family)